MDNINYENRSERSIIQWDKVGPWLTEVAESYGYTIGEISYLFCDDEYLLEINKQYLNHDTYTDIITFDYSYGRTIAADILISLERVEENATQFNATYLQELSRVMAHGVLHCMGLKDKTEEDKKIMRLAEEKAMQIIDNQ